MQNHWKTIKSEIYHVRKGGDIQKLYDLSEKLFDVANQAVTASEEYSEKIVYRTWGWLIGLNIAFAILVLLVYLLSSRQKKLSQDLHMPKTPARKKVNFSQKCLMKSALR